MLLSYYGRGLCGFVSFIVFESHDIVNKMKRNSKIRKTETKTVQKFGRTGGRKDQT
jgi:hypothetical protein